MRKLVCLTLVLMFVLSLFAVPAYASEYVGTVYASNSLCYINNYPIPCYVMNDYMFVQVEDLNDFGFDVKWNAYNETLRIMKDDNKKFKAHVVYRPFDNQIGDKLFDMSTTEVRTYIGNYAYEIECLSGMPGCTYINVDNLSVFGKLNWSNEDDAMYITTSNPSGFSQPIPIKKNPLGVPWYDCDGAFELDGHEHYYEFSHYIDDENLSLWFGQYSEYKGELSACSFCYGKFYADIYDTEGRKVYYTSESFYSYQWEENWKYCVPYFVGEADAPIGYELKIPNSKLQKGKDYMAHVSFWCSWCGEGYEGKIYFKVPYSKGYLPYGSFGNYNL